MQELYKQVLYLKKPLLVLFLIIFISSIVLAENLVETYNDPITYSKGDVRWCMRNGVCTFNTLTVYNLSVIGQVFNVTMNLVTWNITESFNVGGNLVAKNITATNYFGNISQTTGEHWVNETGDTMTGNLSIEVATGEDVEIRIQSGISNKHSYLYLMESDIFGFRLWYDGSGTNTFKFDAIDNDVIIPQIWFDRGTGTVNFFANVDLNGKNLTADYFFGNILNTTVVNTTIVHTTNLSLFSDLNLIGYTVFANNLGGIVGLLDMRGDPWFLGQTDLEIDKDLKVNNTEVENELTVGGNITASFYCDDVSECFPIAVLALDTNASTACDDGEYLDGNGLCIPFNATVEDITKTVFFNATSIETITGTPQGTLIDIQSFNSISYNVSEDASDFELRINFTGIEDFNNLIIRYRAELDFEAHETHIEIWDYVNLEWEHKGDLPSEPEWNTPVFGIFDSTNHIGTGDDEGVVQVRIIQDGGLPPRTHKHEFDWIAISLGLGTPAQEEVDPFFDEWLRNPVFNSDVIVNGSTVNSTWKNVFVTDSIGIGTNNPTYKLQIQADDKALNVSNNLFVNSTNVGIGTDSPDRLLEVFGSSPVLRFRDSGNTSSSTTAFIEFGGTDRGNWNRTGYIGDGASANTDILVRAEVGDLKLGDSSSNSVLTLSGGDATFTGNVGIGTSNPTSKLHIEGSINISNNGIQIYTLGGVLYVMEE